MNVLGDSMTIRVLLVDDHPVVRAGLHAVLETESDLEVVGEASGGVRGIELARELRPEVMVTDLLLPDVDGVVVTRSVRAELPGTQVIILTSLGEESASVVLAIRAGAIGYVVKHTCERSSTSSACRAVRKLRSRRYGPRCSRSINFWLPEPRRRLPASTHPLHLKKGLGYAVALD